MESVEARVPSSLLWPADVNSGASSDDSFVEDLLNFSFADDQQPQIEEEQEEEDKCCFLSASSETQKSVPEDSPKDDFTPGDEINFPTDDVADLEWLSHFVEDSFSERSVALPEISTFNNRPEPGSAQLGFQTPVPAKARSKRGRVRSFRFSPYSSSIPMNRFHGSGPVQFGLKAPMNKPKKQPALVERGSGRRCSHCGVQKTPQWRAGPMGPKTLCNACGVRYKSGRLLPEYRPACSPQFSDELHSNHHRKVLEMRRKKDIPGQPEVPLPGLISLANGSSVE